MNNDFRSRVLMPILLPLAVLVSMAAFVGVIALLLLYNTKGGALMLAAVAAGGILFTVSLATSQDKLDAPRRGVVAFAAALPLLVGAALATGLIGGIADEDRMINVQPLITIPEDAPVIAAQDSLDFCLLDEAGACETTQTWEVVPSEEVDTIAFVFVNLEAGVPHNVAITELEGTVDDPQRGETILASAIVNGVVEDYYVDDTLTWDDLPENWYFLCDVHPNMNGVGTVVEG